MCVCVCVCVFLNEDCVLKKWLFVFCPFFFFGNVLLQTPPNPTSSYRGGERAAWRGRREKQQPGRGSVGPSRRCAQDGWFAYLQVVASQAEGSLHMCI